MGFGDPGRSCGASSRSCVDRWRDPFSRVSSDCIVGRALLALEGYGVFLKSPEPGPAPAL